MMDNRIKVNSIFAKYNLDLSDKEYLIRTINPIIESPMFKKRLTNEFLHHSNITLGEHILEDAVLTYLIAKKKKKTRIDLAVKIAMLHDLYTIPWQNNKAAHVNHFFNKHGFRHPIEAAINSILWYPDIFKNSDEANIIIDGIIHHMFPLPVRSFNKESIKKVELKNINSFNSLDDIYQKMIIDSLNRRKIGILSFSRSKYKEGRIMSLADKKVSLGQIKNFSSFKALFTGHNKSLKK